MENEILKYFKSFDVLSEVCPDARIHEEEYYIAGIFFFVEFNFEKETVEIEVYEEIGGVSYKYLNFNKKDILEVKEYLMTLKPKPWVEDLNYENTGHTINDFI